jgi:hypothetical protein
MTKKTVFAIFALIVVVLSVSALALPKTPNNADSKSISPTPTTTIIRGVPNTSASAITSPPSNIEGINTQTQTYGTGADPNIITLGPKTGTNPDWPTYTNKIGMEFELTRGTPLLAPIDMVLIGFVDGGTNNPVQSGQNQTPNYGVGLYFESISPDWPGMIIYVYHLLSSPLLPGEIPFPVDEWGAPISQGHVFKDVTDGLRPGNGNALSYGALIGYTVRRGELIGYAGGVGDHSFASFCFKVSDTSVNPTVQEGNRYLHWVQPSVFFYWKGYGPDVVFPGGVLAYPFECEGYQLPAEQHDVNFKYPSVK